MFLKLHVPLFLIINVNSMIGSSKYSFKIKILYTIVLKKWSKVEKVEGNNAKH